LAIVRFFEQSPLLENLDVAAEPLSLKRLVYLDGHRPSSTAPG
jgi:hypothetical protein